MRRTKGLDQYGWELGKLLEEVEELGDEKDQYVEQVDLYKKGQVSPQRLETTMYDAAERFSEVEDDVLNAGSTYSRSVNSFETNETSTHDFIENEIDEELREKLIEEGFELVESPAHSGYEASATNNELAYQSFVEAYGEPDFVDDDLSRGEQLGQIVETIHNRFDDLYDEAKTYEAEFLYENLDITLPGAMLDLDDGHAVATLQQDIEKNRAEEIRKNPRDPRHAGLEPDEGVEDLETAREKVRENTPRGKLENQGPSEDELRENNERISEKLEEVGDRNPRGIY
jgi:hypothetical protein